MILNLDEDFRKFKEEILSTIRQELSRQNASTLPEWLTESEAAEYLKVSKQTIRNYRKSGALSFTQRGRKIFISRVELFNFLKSKNL